MQFPDPRNPLQLGPFLLQPLLHGQRFLGLGQVSFEGIPLRSPRLPWTVYSESDRGFSFSNFENLALSREGDSATLTFDAPGSWLPRAQEADSMGDARIRSRRLAPPVARFHWSFRLIREKIQEQEWTGLAMTLEIESAPDHPLHWILEAATWEIGGEASGATLIQQDISTIQFEQQVEKNNAFTTAEKFYTDGGWGGCFPMDMLPRAAGASILDFQAKDNLALCLFAERPSLTRARIDKFAGENVIHYCDRAFFPLNEKVRSPERKLLVLQNPAPLKRHEKRNLWLDCFTEVRSRIQKNYGFHHEIPVPNVFSHLWDDDLKKFGPSWTDALREAFPEFRRLGFTQTFTHGVLNSITSDPNPPEKGNICCPYDFSFAESFGGAPAMKHLAAAAAAEGITLFQWFSFHLSKHAPIWKEHPDWLMHEANGDVYDADYKTLWNGRFLSGYRDWVAGQLKAIRENTGIGGIFWDSYQNFGITAVDWSSPDKAPQAEEIWKMQAELQQLGFRQRCEVTTIFGVSTVGVFGFDSDKFRRRLWDDTLRNDDAFALFDTAPAFFTSEYPFTRKRISPDIYFWLLAHRVVPSMEACPWKKEDGSSLRGFPTLPGGGLAEEYARVNRLYHAALPRMQRLRLTEGGSHVLWLDGNNHLSAAWAFRDCSLKYNGPARNAGSEETRTAHGLLSMRPGEVWLLGDSS